MRFLKSFGKVFDWSDCLSEMLKSLLFSGILKSLLSSSTWLSEMLRLSYLVGGDAEIQDASGFFFAGPRPGGLGRRSAPEHLVFWMSNRNFDQMSGGFFGH